MSGAHKASCASPTRERDAGRLRARNGREPNGQLQGWDRARVRDPRELRYVRHSDRVVGPGAAEGAARHHLHGADRQPDSRAQRRRLAGSARPGRPRRPGCAGRRGHVHGQLRAAEEGGLAADRCAKLGYRRPTGRGARRTQRLAAYGPHRQSELRRRDRHRAGRTPVALDRHRAHCLSGRRGEHRSGQAGNGLGDGPLAAPTGNRHRPLLDTRKQHPERSARRGAQRHRRGGHRLDRVGLPRGGIRRSGDRRMERCRALQDHKQRARCVGRERDVRRGRPSHRQAHPLGYRDTPQPLLQAALLARWRPELRRHPLDREEPVRVEERASGTRRGKRLRELLGRRADRLRHPFQVGKSGRDGSLVGDAGRDVHGQPGAPRGLRDGDRGQRPRRRRFVHAAPRGRQQPVPGHRRQSVEGLRGLPPDHRRVSGP